MLSDQGYEVVAVSSPLEALERARTQKFDAAVLDVAMPEMSGALLHDELRAVDPDLADRTVFISGYVSQDDMVRRVASTVRFLEKPFRTQDLTDKLLEVLPGKQRD